MQLAVQLYVILFLLQNVVGGGEGTGGLLEREGLTEDLW